MKLASGIAPITSLLARNINVALGSDGAASNNRLDIFGEMRACDACSRRSRPATPRRVPAATALRMATLNGAAAIGLDARSARSKSASTPT